MFLEIEGNVLINLDLIDRIEMKPSKELAVMFTGGIIQAESRIAFLYLTANPQLILRQVS